MADDIKKDQGQNPGRSGQRPDNRNNTMTTFQRRTLRKTVISSRTTSRSSRTRAASVGLPNPSIWVPAWIGGTPISRERHRNSTFPNVPSYLIERSHRADLDVPSKILQGH